MLDPLVDLLVDSMVDLGLDHQDIMVGLLVGLVVMVVLHGVVHLVLPVLTDLERPCLNVGNQVVLAILEQGTMNPLRQSPWTHTLHHHHQDVASLIRDQSQNAKERVGIIVHHLEERGLRLEVGLHHLMISMELDMVVLKVLRDHLHRKEPQPLETDLPLNLSMVGTVLTDQTRAGHQATRSNSNNLGQVHQRHGLMEAHREIKPTRSWT